jgi:hypothetical protein
MTLKADSMSSNFKQTIRELNPTIEKQTQYVQVFNSMQLHL